jgi:hypothetical protein
VRRSSSSRLPNRLRSSRNVIIRALYSAMVVVRSTDIVDIFELFIRKLTVITVTNITVGYSSRDPSNKLFV